MTFPPILWENTSIVLKLSFTPKTRYTMWSTTVELLTLGNIVFWYDMNQGPLTKKTILYVIVSERIKRRIIISVKGNRDEEDFATSINRTAAADATLSLWSDSGGRGG